MMVRKVKRGKIKTRVEEAQRVRERKRMRRRTKRTPKSQLNQPTLTPP